MWRKATGLLLCLALIGCAQYSLVPAKRTSIGDLYSVDPQIAWNKSTSGGVELWTVDGPSLEALHFISEVEDGKPLFDIPRAKEEELPVFRAGMGPSEIVELVVDSLARAGANKVEPLNARPAKFGNADGIRFELSFQSAEGLEEDGIVAGAVVNKKLYLILYTGARMHYFPAYKDQVERLIASVQMT